MNPDTIGYTSYFMKVRNRGQIYQYAFDYADQHRREFSSLKTYQELNKRIDRKKLLKEFVVYASGKGVSPFPGEVEQSSSLLSTLITAQIIRNIFDDSGYYPIIQEVDASLLKAIDFFKSE